MNNFKIILKNEISNMGLEINDKQLNKYYMFYKTLTEWNKKINLTAIVEENEIIEKHFIDSLLPLIKNKCLFKGNLIDIGSGAGFPGIPIKILKNDINMTLIDSTRKKVDFINEIIKKIELKNSTAVHARAEDLAKDNMFREKFDLVLSRAVAPLNILLEYCMPYVKKNGIMIAYKSKDYQDELDKSKNALKKLGGELMEVEIEKLPINNIYRSLIYIKKIKNTPKEYPRRTGIPKKKPIK